MRWKHVLFGSLVALALAACGVSPQAGQLARQQTALLAATPKDDAGVRQALLGQAAAWNTLDGLLVKQQLGGMPVGEDFRAVVADVAALARRQRALIAAGEDDPATNRVVLERMRKMWNEVGVYLGR